jgi:predicted MFS family arabinose efflux permease
VSINLGVAAGSPLAGELIDRWGGQVGFLVTAGVGVAAIAVALASWRPLARHLAEAGES